MSANFSLINEFEILEKMIVDHTGEIFKCKHKGTNTFFLLRRYSQSIFNSMEIEIDYLREKTILFDLTKKNSKNIPKIYNSFEDNSYRYFLMEYFQGKTLKQLVEGQTDKDNDNIEEKIIINILKEMLKILSFLHDECFVLHRNIKPSSIIIDENNNIKLIGFHLSAYLKNQKRILVCGKSAKGAKDYVAPEILFGNSQTLDYDYKCDIFSLGYTIYYLMNKELPTKTKIINSKVVRTENPIKNTNYSPWLIKFVQTLYSNDPKQRPTASQALQILENNLNNQQP